VRIWLFKMRWYHSHSYRIFIHLWILIQIAIRGLKYSLHFHQHSKNLTENLKLDLSLILNPNHLQSLTYLLTIAPTFTASHLRKGPKKIRFKILRLIFTVSSRCITSKAFSLTTFLSFLFRTGYYCYSPTHHSANARYCRKKAKLTLLSDEFHPFLPFYAGWSLKLLPLLHFMIRIHLHLNLLQSD